MTLAVLVVYPTPTSAARVCLQALSQRRPPPQRPQTAPEPGASKHIQPVPAAISAQVEDLHNQLSSHLRPGAEAAGQSHRTVDLGAAARSGGLYGSMIKQSLASMRREERREVTT